MHHFFRKIDDAGTPIQQFASQTYMWGQCAAEQFMLYSIIEYFNFFDEFGWHVNVGRFPPSRLRNKQHMVGLLTLWFMNFYLSEFLRAGLLQNRIDCFRTFEKFKGQMGFPNLAPRIKKEKTR